VHQEGAKGAKQQRAEAAIEGILRRRPPMRARGVGGRRTRSRGEGLRWITPTHTLRMPGFDEAILRVSRRRCAINESAASGRKVM
jgi:hypothetical protein